MDRRSAVHLPRTPQVVAAHLVGDVFMGLYPLLPKNTCQVVADFDGATAMLDALAYVKAARASAVPAALEISQSGRGTHVWITGAIDIALLPSLARRDDITTLTHEYGHVVVDECHHLGAAAYEHSVKAIAAQFWLGLTATPTRRDGLGQLVTWQLGPVRHTMTDEEQGTLGAAVHADAGPRRLLFLHDTEFKPGDVDLDAPGALAEVHRRLALDEPRNTLITQDVDAALTRGRNCLVLTRRVAHVEALSAMLSARGHQPLVLQGAMSTTSRRAVVDRLDAAKAGDGLLVIGTTPFIGEGFDAPASTHSSSPARSPTTAYWSNAPAVSSEPHPARTSPRSTTTTTQPPPSSPPHCDAACPDTAHSASPRHEHSGFPRAGVAGSGRGRGGAGGAGEDLLDVREGTGCART
jgi:hypothetical protein